MLSWLLRLILVLLLIRVVWRFVRGLLEGAGVAGPREVHGAAQGVGVPLVKDPVCGTYLVRERAVTEGSGSSIQYFCSERCRDAWRRGDTGRRTA